MRICLKCSAYYADDSLGFCLVDGTPLTGVEPGCEIWSEGSRVIEEKENALRKQKRRFKRWVVASTVLTMLIATMVMSRSVTSVKTQPEPTPSPTPSPSPSPSPTPSGSPTPTPTPTLVYKISGRVTESGRPISGVHVILGGTTTSSQTTDANGIYTFPRLPSGGSYTITPARAKTKFTPGNRSINNLTQDVSADFSGLVEVELYKISGRVTESGRPLAGINMMLGGTKTSAQATDANGNYTFARLPSGGSYTITPAGAKTKFTPGNRSFNNLTQDASADFSGVVDVELYKISGRVTEAGRPLAGVNMMIGGTRASSQSTDANGNYTFVRLPSGGSYTITPSRAKTRFAPGNRSFNNLTQDGSADFSGVVSRDHSPPPPPPPECTAVDKDREHRTILDRYSAGWRRKFESERSKIAPYADHGMEHAASIGQIEYQSRFITDCTGAVVTARYAWQIKTMGPGGLVEDRRVARVKRFSCSRLGGSWLCFSL